MAEDNIKTKRISEVLKELDFSAEEVATFKLCLSAVKDEQKNPNKPADAVIQDLLEGLV